MQRAERYNRPGLQSAASRTPLLSRDLNPALNLDFASGVLDPRIDFQRTTVGTYYRGQFNQNILLRSQEFDNTTTWATATAGTGVAPVRTANNAVDPDGTTTADTLTFNTGVGTTASDQSLILQSITFTTGRQYTLSFWVRGTVGGEKLTVRQLGAAAYTLVTATTSWQRISVTETATIGGNIQIGIRQSISGHGVINSTATVEIWGAQLTEGSLLTPYIPTTTAAITQGQIASSPPWNLYLRSQEFDNTATWTNVIGGTGVNAVRTANNAVAPDGTTTADTLTFNAGAGTTSGDLSLISQTTLGATTGQAYTGSVWMRGTVGGEQIVFRHSTTGVGTLLTLTTQWQRFSTTVASHASNVTQIGIRQGHFGTINATATIEIWGAQINEGSVALDYSPTTTVANWLPRFENDPVTGAARGLLIENGATNLLQQSAAVRTSPWSVAGLTTAGVSITAPDGTNNGVELVWASGTGAGSGYTLQNITALASTAYTFSVYLKPKGTGINTLVYLQARSGGVTLSSISATFSHTNKTITINTSGTFTNTSAAITDVGNDWFRVSITGTTPATTDAIRAIILNATTGNGTDGVYAWGAQVESQGLSAGYPSSYIPTTTATVARGADGAVMTGTNFSSWYNQSEGTFLIDGVSSAGPTYEDFLSIDDGGTNNSIRFMRGNAALNGAGTDASFILRRSGNAEIQWFSATALGTFTSGTTGKYCVGLVANDGAGVFNNGTIRTDNAFGMPTVNRMALHGLSLASHNIRRIAYWPTRLPNATLQSLTT